MRFLVLLLPLLAGAADYDMLIRNVRVVDQTGNARFRADVAVEGDRIAATGKLDRAAADRVIEANNGVVSPAIEEGIPQKATFQNPHQDSEGFDFVLINGKFAVDSGKITEARSGRAFRRQ